MKTTLLICLGMMIWSVAPTLLAEDAPPRFVQATVDQSERSLKNALESQSPGMQLSAANTTVQLRKLLQDREFSLLVIPLMRIVKDEYAETASRVMASIALHELRSARGDFAISRVAEFTRDAKVKNTCAWLTYYRMMEGSSMPADQSTTLLHFPSPEPLPESALY